MKPTPISAEDYLRNVMSKAYHPQKYEKFTKHVDHFAQLHKHEHSNVMETERKDMMANICTILPPRDGTLEHSETIRQKGNRIKEMQEYNKHIIKELLS